MKSLKTEMDSISYAIGMSVARNVKNSIAEIDRGLFIQGFKNSMDSTNVLINETEEKELLDTLKKKGRSRSFNKSRAGIS